MYKRVLLDTFVISSSFYVNLLMGQLRGRPIGISMLSLCFFIRSSLSCILPHRPTAGYNLLPANDKFVNALLELESRVRDRWRPLLALIEQMQQFPLYIHNDAIAEKFLPLLFKYMGSGPKSVSDAATYAVVSYMKSPKLGAKVFPLSLFFFFSVVAYPHPHPSPLSLPAS